jgi:hypothetical protein
MFDSEGRKKRIEVLIDVLAKLHAVVEMSGADCPLCRTASAHDHECPLSIALHLLDTERQAEVHRNVRAFALSIELALDDAESVVH